MERRHRWLGVGASRCTASAVAGREVVAEAVAGRDDPRLLVLFASEAHDLHELLAAVEEASGGVPLVGCSTAGEIHADGPADAGAVCVAFGGPGFQVSTACVPAVSGRLREAGAEAAACLGDVGDAAHRVLLLLPDGLAGDQQEIVRGAYSVAGAGVPLVGGCAGDDLRMVATRQFHGARVVDNGIVAAAIGSDAPLGIGVRHGWRPVGEPMLVTHSESSRVLRIDERPALDVYLERLQAPAEVRADPEAFTRYALTHPLGLARREHEEQVRFVAGADFAERSLLTIAGVPQGGLVWLMEGDRDSVLHATDTACQDALRPLGDAPPLGMVVFDCIARRGVLADEGIQQEVRRVVGHAAGAPVAGFYTYGEIARVRGITGFHNQTLVVLAVG